MENHPSSNIFKRIAHAMNPSAALKNNPTRFKLWVFWIIFNIVLFFIPNSWTYSKITLLLPVAGLFAFAIISHELYEATFMGCLSMFVLWFKGSAVTEMAASMRKMLLDPDTLSLNISFFMLGAVICALTQSGVAKSFSNWVVKKFGQNEKVILCSAGFFSSVMCVDDFVSTLVCGAAFSPLMDAIHKPRLAMALVMRTCATCVANLLPFGAWGIFAIYQIANGSNIDGMDQAREIFMSTIPFQIFPFIAIVMALLFALGLMPKVGMMKKAYEAAEADGTQLGSVEGAAEEIEEVERLVANDPRKQNLSILNLFLPIAAIVFFLFYYDFDMLLGYSAALFFIGVLYVLQGIFTVTEYVDCIIQGARDMADLVIILALGYVIQDILQIMGFEEFILGVCTMIPYASLIPVAVFLWFAFEEYLFSLNYTIYQIMLPVFVVVLPAAGANVPLTLGALFSGCLFGANSCVISDLGIVSAKANRVGIYDQFVACQPYYWPLIPVCAVIYLILGFIFT